MSDDSTHDVTRLLQAWGEGDLDASARLLPLIYDPLRHIARNYMERERRGHTLEPTALVHEAYLRLVGGAHFYSLAARAIRRILVDHARARQPERRGGVQQRVPLEEAELVLVTKEDGPVDLVALDDALGRLASPPATVSSGRIPFLRRHGWTRHRRGLAGFRPHRQTRMAVRQDVVHRELDRLAAKHGR